MQSRSICRTTRAFSAFALRSDKRKTIEPRTPECRVSLVLLPINRSVVAQICNLRIEELHSAIACFYWRRRGDESWFMARMRKFPNQKSKIENKMWPLYATRQLDARGRNVGTMLHQS